MRKYGVYMLLWLVCGVSAGCMMKKTRKPKSDLKTEIYTLAAIDNRITVDTLLITPVDTLLNAFKSEALLGITLKGYIRAAKEVEFRNAYYFKRVDIIQTRGRNHFEVQLIPQLAWTLPDAKPKSGKTRVKYNDVPFKREFEMYIEVKLKDLWYGEWSVRIGCGGKETAVSLFRTK